MTLFCNLGAAVSAEKYDSVVVLGAITASAQALTGASSAALAMRRDGLVICRARSGDMAPDIGSRLSVDSGISGECLRTGKVLRCDDTLKDLRADPEVCRRLGLRSIAAVPLRGRRGTMGVLEAFSTKPYAFAEEHMDHLIRLAELAEAARLRESGVVETVAGPKSLASAALDPDPPRVATTAATLLAPARTFLGQARDPLQFRRIRLVLAALSVPLVMLLGFSGWSAWRKVPAQAAAATQAAAAPLPPAAVAQTLTPAASSDLVWKPSPVRVAPPQNAANSGIQAASKREVEQTSNQPAPPSTSKTDILAEASPPPPIASMAAPTAPEPPQLNLATSDKARVATLTSVPVDLPAFGSPVSQGMTGGELQRKVMPSYPVAAVPLRLAGTVVLNATVGEKGNVEEIKIASGPPLLTAAAVDAVRQWRYSPFLLNGKAVKMQKQISISFRAP
jgi:protein TonB